MAKRTRQAKTRKRAKGGQASKTATGGREICTQRELAKALGISQPTVSKLLKRSDWPTRRHGPWSSVEVQQVKAWRESLQEDRAREDYGEGSAAIDELKRAKLQIEIIEKRERANFTKFRHELERQEHVRKDLLERAMGGLAGEFVAIFEEMELAGPKRFAEMSPEQFGRHLDHYRKRIVDRGKVELKSLSDTMRDVEAKRKRRT